MCIVIGVTLTICVINFCLRHKFCQHYDENLDSKVGGFSICDAFSCLLTCGLIFREKPVAEGPSLDELDFRKRFEKSMENNRTEIGYGETKRRKRNPDKKPKAVMNYLSDNAKSKIAMGTSKLIVTGRTSE